MNVNHKYVPMAALAAALFLTVAGCKSNTQQATDQNAQNPQEAASAEPGTAAAPGGSAANGTAAPRRAAPARPAPVAAIELPAGTQLRVRLDEDLGSKISQPGEVFPQPWRKMWWWTERR